MDIYEALRRDHDEVSILFETLFDTDATAPERRHHAFKRLRRVLRAHSSAEQALFYPLLKDHEQTHDLVEHATGRYGKMNRLLSEMAKMNHRGDAWMDKCRALHQGVEEHVDEEENRIFPQARHILSEEQARQLGAQIAEQERLVQATPKGVA